MRYVAAYERWVIEALEEELHQCLLREGSRVKSSERRVNGNDALDDIHWTNGEGKKRKEVLRGCFEIAAVKKRGRILGRSVSLSTPTSVSTGIPVATIRKSVQRLGLNR